MDIGLMVVAQEVEGELAGQGEDSGIAADATGVLIQAFVKDVVEAVLDTPVCADVLSRRARLMETLDTINKRFGRETARFLAEGVRQPWRMKRLLKSPAYTTRLEEIPVAKC